MSDDTYEKEEAQRRFEKALKGGFKSPPAPKQRVKKETDESDS